jgi:hypothetical protein
MPLRKKPISCMPCAKRKVRCDKLQPCCHCKRRQQDTCVYPEFGRVDSQYVREQAVRIGKLEEYVRILGGNPNELNVRAQLDSTQVDQAHEQVSVVSSKLTKAGPDFVSRTQRSTQITPKLVENDGESTYIET